VSTRAVPLTVAAALLTDFSANFGVRPAGMRFAAF
jgi:hypothetical protein